MRKVKTHADTFAISTRVYWCTFATRMPRLTDGDADGFILVSNGITCWRKHYTSSDFWRRHDKERRLIPPDHWEYTLAWTHLHAVCVGMDLSITLEEPSKEDRLREAAEEALKGSPSYSTLKKEDVLKLINAILPIALEK
jgi:hypothetical protein